MANIYALLLKLSLLDVDNIQRHGEHSFRHPLRRGRLHSRLFLLLLPGSLLAIALTGVGFIDVIADAADGAGDVAFSRLLLSSGACGTWTALTLKKALYKPLVREIHLAKLLYLAVCSFGFLLPLIFSFSRAATVATTVGIQFLILLSQISCTLRSITEAPKWKCGKPRLLKDWQDLDSRIGAGVSSNEHFFTVLLAVAVFSLNESLAKTNDVQRYTVTFFTFAASLGSTMAYASRFNDEDAAHKLLWSVYELLLMLQLEGLTADPSSQFSLFKIATSKPALAVEPEAPPLSQASSSHHNVASKCSVPLTPPHKKERICTNHV